MKLIKMRTKFIDAGREQRGSNGGGSRGGGAEEARKFLDGVMTESRTVYLTDFQDFRLVSSIADNGPV